MLCHCNLCHCVTQSCHRPVKQVQLAAGVFNTWRSNKQAPGEAQLPTHLFQEVMRIESYAAVQLCYCGKHSSSCIYNIFNSVGVLQVKLMVTHLSGVVWHRCM